MTVAERLSACTPVATVPERATCTQRLQALEHEHSLLQLVTYLTPIYISSLQRSPPAMSISVDVEVL